MLREHDIQFMGADLDKVLDNTVVYWKPKGANMLVKVFRRLNTENGEGGFFREFTGCNGPCTLISVTQIDGRYYIYMDEKPTDRKSVV